MLIGSSLGRNGWSGYALLSFLWVKLDCLSNFCNMVSWAETFPGHALVSMCSD